jgi:hypothetical protein
MKDGIDIRETLRHWHDKKIYVREIPPSKGPVDTVVIIFDAENDELYPHRGTWYAEHTEESTLSFYATNPFDDLIGPGIARCRYGGLSLIFPPRPIPDIFTDLSMPEPCTLSEKLTLGSLLFAKERAVAYVCSKKPSVRLRTFASRLKKHLVWIPLSHFSTETMEKLRRFHILNGKEIRGWAAHFISD